MSFQKILIIGSPGSGKSTFARALRDLTDLPLFHLDMLYWNADKTTVSRDLFDERLQAVLEQEKWIIDGNFSRTMEWRLSLCDKVFFLDLPSEICLESVRGRIGTQRTDLPWLETEEDAEFMDYIRSFPIEQKPKILSLLQKFPKLSVTVFSTRVETELYLRMLKEKR